MVYLEEKPHRKKSAWPVRLLPPGRLKNWKVEITPGSNLTDSAYRGLPKIARNADQICGFETHTDVPESGYLVS